MNTSPPPESSSRSAAAPTRTTPGTIVIGSTCWAVMTPMIADPQTPRSSCVYYCTLRTLAPAIHHTKVHVKALDARLGALPCQESWLVGPLEVPDEFGGDAAADLARGVAGADPGEDGLGLRCGQGRLRPARDELEEQVVQLSDHPGVLLAQCPAPIGQGAQH